jgi:hypothetical protein
VRLGLLEEHLGDGTVERTVAEPGVQPGVRDRLMSLPMVARLLIAMTLAPNVSYVEAVAQLAGLLAGLPWAKAWHVPSAKVVTEWRRRLGVAAMRELFSRIAGAIAAALWHGLEVCALDGTQVSMPDTDENRARYGSSGTSDDSASFPMLRLVVATARAGRALLAAALDARDVGEQTLVARIVAAKPGLFRRGRVWLVDRNYLGFDLIESIHDGGKGSHLVMRIKEGINLPNEGWLPDGSYRSRLRSADGRRHLAVRVVEYDVRLTDGTLSELFCLATTMVDHDRYPAKDVADLYKQRWPAVETAIGQAKAAITDDGPSRGPMLRSKDPELVEQEVWAWLAATQLARKAAHAATASATTDVDVDEISFVTIRREATRSMTQSLVTATTTPQALAAAAEQAATRALANRVTIDRDRRSPRVQKPRPGFPRSSKTKTTTKGALEVNLATPPATRGPVPASPATSPPRSSRDPVPADTS